MNKKNIAIFTYLCNDLFLDGALALIRSLKTNSPLITQISEINCLCLEDVSQKSRQLLIKEGYQIEAISKNEYLVPNHSNFLGRYKNRAWMMFSKLKIFSFLNYEFILYLDSDVIVRGELNNIFNDGYKLAAVEDNISPNKKNNGLSAGVLAFCPEENIWDLIQENINNQFDQKNTDQSLLNALFPNFYRLPRKYNTLDKLQRFIKISKRKESFDQSLIYHFNGPKPWIPFYKNYGWKLIPNSGFFEFWIYLLSVNNSRKYKNIIVLILNISIAPLIGLFNILRLKLNKLKKEISN